MNIIKKKLNSAVLILSLIGLVDSLYLTILKVTNNQSLCLKGIGDCWSVNISRYSEIAGIPVAILGAGVYLAIVLLTLFEDRLPILREYGNLFLFGITLIGVIYSAYLTYVEIAILNAICPFCVLSAVLMVGLLALAIYRLILNSQADRS